MGVKIALFVTIGLAAIAAILFSIAGRVDWIGAWVLLALCALFFLISGSSMIRKNPDLVRERMKSGGPSATGDRGLMAVYRLLLLALFVVAALDAGRYRWSEMPWTVQALGVFAMAAGFAMVWWCSATNAYLSSVVRIQSDRGQHVIEDGPYRYVRHPMYVGLIAVTIGMSLLLGSWLALIPTALVAVVLMIRISLEERVLRDGLEGYVD